MDGKTVSEQYALVADKLLFRYGKSFHWARYFLGREASLEATRLYAFCRYLDDIADNDENDNITKLKSIEDVFNNNSNETENSPEVYGFLQ